MSVRKWHFQGFWEKKRVFDILDQKTVQKLPIWPTSCNVGLFLVPRPMNSLSCVRPSELDLRIRSWIFLVSCTKLQLHTYTEVTFWDLGEKILFLPFWPKNGQKVDILALKWSFRPISPNQVLKSSSYLGTGKRNTRNVLEHGAYSRGAYRKEGA